MHEFSTWTIAEANAIIPVLVQLSDSTQARLDNLGRVWGALSFKKYDVVRGLAEDDLIRMRWALRVEELGAIPIGFFVVDFPTSDPEIVLCWRHGQTHCTREYKSHEKSRYCRRTGATLP